MYEEGQPASNCPLNTSPANETHPSLCKSADDTGPQEKNTTSTGVFFYCAFDDEDNCGLSFDNTTFVTKRKIVQGYYLHIEVPANERVRMELPRSVGSRSGFCIEITQRKGAATYGEAADNEFIARLDIPSHRFSVNSSIGIDYNEWTKFDLAIEWKYKTNIAFEFSASENATAQYLDLRKLLVYKGDCLLPTTE